LAEVIESRGLKIWKNIQIWWISMLTQSKRFVFEYKSVVMKLLEDLPTNHVAATNYELLCDVETMMGLTCVLLMLEAVQNLNKLVQNKDCFISDFVASMKLIQVDIYNLYVDLKSHFHMTNSSILWIWWSLI
jgi:hypothetical protein